MLRSITFGTFYFFLGEFLKLPLTFSRAPLFISANFSFLKPVFCLILLVWVYFFVPETKGVPIEEMDKLFGGNQGEEDLHRIADIRLRLGIRQADDIRRASVAQGIGDDTELMRKISGVVQDPDGTQYERVDKGLTVVVEKA
jgi:hypothetical protein